MFKITDEHIDFILCDIKDNGVENEDLQNNLLDHICCIIEEQLEQNGNFEECYQRIKTSFYKQSYSEIEEETKLLLTYKNYYAMKKVMLFSGVFSASILSLGIVFKFMHWPGASMGSVLGLVIFTSLIYIKSKGKIKHKR